MKRRFYPSNKKSNIEKFNHMINNSYNQSINLEPLVNFNDENTSKIYQSWVNRFSDNWSNAIANINANNALGQYSEFMLNRLSYAECAFLAGDSIINNAITKYENEIFRRGGNIIINNIDNAIEAEAIKQKLEQKIKELDLYSILGEAVRTALTFGGALIFIDINADDLSEPLYDKAKILSQNKINGLRVIPPYLCGASEVETANPLNADFMKPKKWYISGNAGIIDSSRVIPLTIFEAPSLIKPLFNFFGISLTQFMKNYVASADIARQSLSDMLLRFRSEIIKSDLIKINPSEAVSRAKAINKQKNNNALMLLTKDEEYIQSITPLSGLDKLIAQLQENVAVSARMPSVKLLGLTPSGFNATGDFDLASYYDEIMSLQNSKIKPVIEKILDLLVKSFGWDNVLISYEFNTLEKSSDLDKAQAKNLEMDFITKAIQNGILTSEQAFNYLKEKGLINESFTYDDEAEQFNEFEAEQGGEINAEAEAEYQNA